MRLCRAASSRSILALAVATATLTAVAAPTLAQGFAPGMTLFAAPEGIVWNVPPSLSEDGTAMGSEYWDQVASPVTGGVVRPNGRTVFTTPSRVDDISDGGTYAVEYSTRRDSTGSPQSLLPGVFQPSLYNAPSRISGNGQVVAGTRADNPNWPTQAYRWTPETGSQYLGPHRPDALYTSVFGISRDGSTIVGDGQMQPGALREAWKWTESDGFTILPTLPDARPQASRAYASNGDGSIIVGYDSGPVVGFRPIIWTNGVPAALPIINGYRTAWLTDLSDDGSIIIGTHMASQIGLPDTFAVWTTANGWLPALDFLRGQGIAIPSYFTSSSIEVSADGRTFATRLTDSRDDRTYLAVFVVPSPNGLALLGLAVASTRRSRERR
jgi:uncharacterized membrane protein